MNRRRRQKPQTAPTNLRAAFIALGLATVLGVIGGSMYAIYQNGQIKTARKIAEAQERIKEHHTDIQMIEVRNERLLDRYEIREQLQLIDSSLVEVEHRAIERVRRPRQPDHPPIVMRP